MSFIDPFGEIYPLHLTLQTLTTHARNSELPQYGAQGPTPDHMPVPWLGTLTGVDTSAARSARTNN